MNKKLTFNIKLELGISRHILNSRDFTLECVFINKDDNTEWSRDKYFALSSSDTPLHSGQGRNVIVYSSKGFEKKTRKVPNLTVEIYVNGEAIDKIDVKKS